MTTKTTSGFACQECGHKFRTVAAARRAADRGCPKCGGVDVDLDVKPTTTVMVPGGRLERDPTYGTFAGYAGGEYLGVFRTEREARYEVERACKRQEASRS